MGVLGGKSAVTILCYPRKVIGWGVPGCLTSDWHHSPSSVSAEAAEIMRDIGTAIQFLHSRNIAHRDVKVRLQDPGWGTKRGSTIHNPQWLPAHTRWRSNFFKADAPWSKLVFPASSSLVLA